MNRLKTIDNFELVRQDSALLAAEFGHKQNSINPCEVNIPAACGGELQSENSNSLETLILSSNNSILQTNVDYNKQKLFDYFGFNSNPFGDSLDTEFYFQNENIKTATTKILMTIEHDISFGLIYGESGTGKTILSQNIIENLNLKKYKPILIPVSPGFSKTAFLKNILDHFIDFKNLQMKDTNQIINLLSNEILNLYKSGIKPIFFIDECHFLSSDAIHILRTLSNFEANNKKIITCILISEPIFLRRLKNPSYASLRSRIYIDVELKHFDFYETEKYIQNRLSVSGVNFNFFNGVEMQSIFDLSGGNPRLINKECSKIIFNKYISAA